jgi:hypothetical protein
MIQREEIKKAIRKLLTEDTNDDNNIIFVRTTKFDNTGAVNKLPYDGIHCWAIRKKDFEKYINELELWGGRRKDVEIINPNGYDIFALEYPKTHNYVMGQTDKIPKLEKFNKEKHILSFIKQDKNSMLPYISDMKYQVLLVN